MTTQRRLDEIESILDNMDPDHKDYLKLEEEADQIVDSINAIKAVIEAQHRQKLLEQEAKIEEIIGLVKAGKTNELVDLHGHEFVDDYRIEFFVITSHVSEEQWTLESDKETQTKLKQLLYYRIYNKYCRERLGNRK
jgi:hypothetical protein